jgi:hypothetical protein
MVSSPAGFTAELEWELEVQGHKDGMVTLSAMVAWPTGRSWVRADRFGERRKAFSRCLCGGGSIEAARVNDERTRKPAGIVFDEQTDEDGQCVLARLQDG